ncbi:MAG: pyrroline-5-carboxylate reductase [Leptospirales bacterium]|jgi:pyrroline-5-carboxylate reductase
MNETASTSRPDAAGAEGLRGQRLGFLGFGKMGQAIARGLRDGHAPGDLALAAYDPIRIPEQVRAAVAGLEIAASPLELEARCDVLILAVKPGDLPAALADLKGDRKYISIAAGVGTEGLRKLFPGGQNPQISRVMPNISALAGHSASGIYCAEDEFFSTSEAIFSAIGQVVRIKSEDLMHAVTGLSGSGPAYVLAMVHALAEGGVQAGLPFQTALDLARETLLGTAHLLRATGEHPAALRNQVTSPGGTTIAGLAALEDGGFHGTVMRAVEAATERSRELE